MKIILGSVLLTLSVGSVMAKLPPPTPDEAARSKETAARAAWQTQVDNFKLCEAQNRVAQHYRSRIGPTSAASAPTPTPACTDPGAFTPPAPEIKPLEAAGAHSPPPTAASPPNTRIPAAVANPTPKR